MNLMVHQVNNRFSGGTYLDGLELLIRDGRELIAGSGIYDTFVYPLTRIDAAIAHFRQERLPPGLPLVTDETTYWDCLLRAFVRLIKDEYHIDAPAFGSSSVATAGVVRFDVKESALLTMRESAAGAEDTALGVLDQLSDSPAGSWPKLAERFAALQQLLQNVLVLRTPLEPEELIVASGGLYMDCVLGMLPATEPYSERMRELERDRVAAQVDHLRAHACREFTRHGSPYFHERHTNWIRSIEVAPRGERFAVLAHLVRAHDSEGWVAFLDGTPVPEPVQSERTVLQFLWPQSMEMPTIPELRNRLRFHDIESAAWISGRLPTESPSDETALDGRGDHG